MWKCPGCGIEIEDQFDTCWKCLAAAELGKLDVPGPTDSREDDPGTASPEQILRQILKLQTQHAEELSTLQWRVGCLFWYMLVGIALAALGLILGLKYT